MTGVDKRKALPYLLRVNLRKLVEVFRYFLKGSSRPLQRFLEPNLEVHSISELSVGKILTVYHHGIEKIFPL